MEPSKLVFIGNDALAKIQKGIRLVADVVETTIGPRGQNALLSRDWRIPDITNDGVTIARSIIVDDEAENIAIQAFVDVAKRTNEEAGDGTTTSIILARAILEKGWEALEKGDGGQMMSSTSNPMQLKKEIKEGQEHVLAELKKVTTKADKLDRLKLVATASMEDEEIGGVIANIVHKIGVDGFIGVEEGFQHLIETEIVEGMKFHGTYSAPYMMTNDRKEAVFEKADILVTNFNFDNPLVLKKITENVAKNGKKALIVFGKKFSKGILIEMAKAKKAGFHFLAVKTPSLLTEEYEDIAVFTKAKFFNEDNGDRVDKSIPSDLGYADRVAINSEDTFIMGGRGTKKEIVERIKTLREYKGTEEIDSQKKRVDMRIASMTSGIGIIKVGARSDAERLYLKRKVEDAQYATKAALAEGTVKGGGLALKEIGDKMGESILSEALKAPYEQIQHNAGGKLEIPDTVIDPVKVTRTALQNACSIATMLLTTKSIVVEERERKEYDGLKRIADNIVRE